MVKIEHDNIKEAVDLSQEIPEFENPYDAAEYRKRMQNGYSLILVARDAEKPAGFKAGYALNQKVFYSWMGGVLPSYPMNRISSMLANQQQNILRKVGFEILQIKTRNKHRAMLQMLLKDDFFITSVETRPSPNENRIILEKKLTTDYQNNQIKYKTPTKQNA